MPPPLPSSSPPLPPSSPPPPLSSPPRPSTPDQADGKVLVLRNRAVSVATNRPIAKCRPRKKQQQPQQQQQQQQPLIDNGFEPVHVRGWSESELTKLLSLLKTLVGPITLYQLCFHLGRETYDVAATIIHLRQAAEKAAIDRGREVPEAIPRHLRRPIANPMPDGRVAVLNNIDETAVVLYETEAQEQTSMVYYVRPGDRFTQLA